MSMMSMLSDEYEYGYDDDDDDDCVLPVNHPAHVYRTSQV